MAPQPSLKRLLSLPKRKAEFIEPMDCAHVSKLPDGSQWVFEIKLDGYRAVAVKSAVAQIEFLEWSEGDRLRHSKFIGLRNDKNPHEVVKEHPSRQL